MNKKPDLIALGRRIRAAREARGLAQADLAESAGGVSRELIRQIEKGMVRTPDPRLEAIATRLAVPLPWLLSGHGPAPDLTPLTGRRAMRVVGPMSSTARHQPPFPNAIPESRSGVGAAGPYSPVDRVSGWWSFPDTFVQHDLRTESGALRVFKTHSDSMEPLVRRGSYIVVDTSQTQPVDGALFAIDNKISIVLKRLTAQADGNLVLTSEASRMVTDPAEIKIIGRVVAQISFL